MIGRIVRSADFERVLKAPTQARSAHFAVHYLASLPSQPAKPRPKSVSTELSTDVAPLGGMPVDKSLVQGLWMGAVVPKRHARRAVTRTLIKRQIRRALVGQAGLASGLWVVRLRSPFDRANYPSAASEALRIAAAAELSSVLSHAVRRAAA